MTQTACSSQEYLGFPWFPLNSPFALLASAQPQDFFVLSKLNSSPRDSSQISSLAVLSHHNFVCHQADNLCRVSFFAKMNFIELDLLFALQCYEHSHENKLLSPSERFLRLIFCFLRHRQSPVPIVILRQMEIVGKIMKICFFLSSERVRWSWKRVSEMIWDDELIKCGRGLSMLICLWTSQHSLAERKCLAWLYLFLLRVLTLNGAISD